MGKTVSIITLLFLLCGKQSFVFAQYEPAAGMPGTSAIHKDSNIFVGWANQCLVQAGWVDCMNTNLGFTGPNDSSLTLGMADGIGVVSLGDGGMATLQFPFPIANGPGHDFAVFENSFSDDFLEFAFVEVSSNGMDFFRFPAASLTDTILQTGTFGLSNPELIHNLAGKYRFYYGTPFDLQNLDTVLNLDLQRITHVRIVDVVGCINCELFTNRDAQGRIVNDPYPTPFPQGGFDLDAVGVIHFAPAGFKEMELDASVKIFPNPLQNGEILQIIATDEFQFENLVLYDGQGKVVFSESSPKANYKLPNLESGIYFLRGNSVKEKKNFHQKISILP
jgi:hypothetical protein